MQRALFFDVDGTLIDSFHDHRTISPAVRAELARVQGLGHKIFLSSGRSRVMITDNLLEPGFDGMVLINGGNVELGGVSLYEERMGYELAHATTEFVRDLGYEYLYVAARHSYTRSSFGEVRAFFHNVDQPDIFTYDVDEDVAQREAIKMEAMVPVEDRARVTELARERLGTRITCDGHGGEGTFELYPTAISKAKGIEAVLAHLGIDAAHAYAFGDGSNDLEMIRYCGCGVAMGNAEEAVKEAADIVCPPVWEDGLAQILHELF